MHLQKKSALVLASPFLIMSVSFAVAWFFGSVMGKWAFIPIIVSEWCLFMFFVFRYGRVDSMNRWLGKSSGSFRWIILAVGVGLIPLPLFLLHADTLSSWPIWLPWLVLACVNPWIEEFYWRGLLLDYTAHWPAWPSVLFTSLVFGLSHAVFGINSQLNRGFAVIGATFVMGIAWAIVYKKTNSLRWIIFAHFLVDFFGLSAPAFLDLWNAP